jgi:hypothetical protein
MNHESIYVSCNQFIDLEGTLLPAKEFISFQFELIDKVYLLSLKFIMICSDTVFYAVNSISYYAFRLFDLIKS